MLKSDLVISQKIEKLDKNLKYFCSSVLTPTFPDDNKASESNYEAVFWQLYNSLKGKKEQFRDRFIPHLLDEKNILSVINSDLTTNDLKESIIDAELLDNTVQQIAIVNKNIDDFSLNTSINQAMVIQYYFNSLQLLSYFTAIRSSIATIKNICKKFNYNDNSCVLKFIHVKKNPLAILQQKTILDFIERVLCDLFGGYIGKFETNVDSGSPEFEIIIKILAELDLNILLSELFELILKIEIVKATHKVIVINTMLNKNCNKKEDDKQLSKEDIERRILEINKEYNDPLGIYFTIDKRDKSNKLEIHVSSFEKEDISGQDAFINHESVVESELRKKKEKEKEKEQEQEQEQEKDEQKSPNKRNTDLSGSKKVSG